MTKILIKIPNDWPADRADSMIQGAFNQGFTTFVAEGESAAKLAKVDRVQLYSYDSTRSDAIQILKGGTSTKIDFDSLGNSDFGIDITISTKEDEKQALSYANKGTSFLICKTTDWKIIPFENLIANLTTQDTQLYADIGSSLADADLLLHTLEKGVDGLVFSPKSENDLVDIKKLLKENISIKIETAKILKITPISEADRVCVDTSSMLHAGEGMLVGATAMGFALVHAEVFESEFVNSRPFRVNAGDVSEYILVPKENPDGTMGYRTNYLSELKAGDKVLVGDIKGNLRAVSIGRVKIENRPMLLFNLEVPREKKAIPLIVCIQNAETVRMVNSDQKPISSTDLKVGDEILVHIGPGATHFGTAIKETIIEK